MSPDPTGSLLTVAQAASRAKVHRQTIYVALWSGAIHPHVLSGHWYIEKTALAAWIAERRLKKKGRK